MKLSMLLLTVIILAIGLVPMGFLSSRVSFYVKASTVVEYNASFYVIAHGVKGKPLNANVSAIIVSIHGNYSDIQEFKYVHVIGANNTSRTLEYSDRVRIFYPNPYSMIVGPGVIPYLLSKNIADSLWLGRLNKVNISFWNLTNMSLRLSDLKVNTSIGLCKCVLIKGIYRKEYLLHNIVATLCYNRYGLLGYANITTGYLEPANMRGAIRVLEYNAINASIRLNKTALNSRGPANNNVIVEGSRGRFNYTELLLPVILIFTGILVLFLYKYSRRMRK